MKGTRTTLRTAACLVGLALIFTASPAAADQVILDDLIVDRSLCVGFDCVNGESFGLDTIRLKEHKLRIHFMDTSSAASFPDNDWRIVINDSASGGAEYFAVEDSSAGRQVFRVYAGARSNSLVVDSQGDVGIGTSTPATDLHVKIGDTPTLRLEQDSTSGFQPQTWDLAGNESNFFLRDVTNGSALPIRSRPGARTSSPDEELHVRRTDAGPTRIKVENSGANQAGMVFENSAREWSFTNTGAGNFVINDVGDPNELTLTDAGTLTISGSINTTDCSPCVSDYVFEPGYELMPLADLEAFVQREGHLPNVPSQADVDRAGKLNMNEMQMRMLEKIEELVLYTLEQQATIDEQQTTIEVLQQRLATLERRSE